MLIAIPFSSSNPVKAALVNWLPWPVLKISGLPYRASASSTASMQKSTSIVMDSRHDRTRRLTSVSLARAKLAKREGTNPPRPRDRRSRGPSGCR